MILPIANFMKSKRGIRHRIAGIFVQDEKILLVKHRKSGREYYLLPGGGQELGETAAVTLAREWQEELSLKIKVGNFIFCGESVPQDTNRAQVFQMVFEVESIEGKIEVHREGALAGHAWIPIRDLESIAFFPACLEQVKAYCRGEKVVPYERYRWLT